MFAMYIFPEICPDYSPKGEIRMPQKPPVRMLLVAAALLLCMTGMIVQLFAVLQTDHVAEAGVRQGQYHLHVPLADGLIYDRNFSPINGAEVQHLAVAVPTPETVSAIFAQIRDRDAVSAQIQSGVPFVCALNAPVEPRENLYLLEGRTDPDGPLPAQHLLGYIQNGSRVAGLQLACADWLAQCDTAADLTFTVSGTGAVLAGAESSIVMQGYAGGGIVTALDLPMQRIAEQALAAANRKFRRRWAAVEALARAEGHRVDELSTARQNELWREVKAQE